MKNLTPFFIIVILCLSSSVSFGQKINWMTLEEAENKAKTNPKKIFVNIFHEWNGWCKKMNKSYKDPDVIAVINEHFYAVNFNAEEKKTIEFRGLNFEYQPTGKKGTHQFALAVSNNKLATPFIVFFDKNLDMISGIPGYRNSRDLHPLLKFIGEDHYLTMNWESYMANEYK